MGLLKVKPNEAEVYVIARKLDEFPALVEDLNRELSGTWAPIALKNGDSSIKAGVGSDLEIAIVAVSKDDENQDLGTAAKVIQTARDHGGGPGDASCHAPDADEAPGHPRRRRPAPRLGREGSGGATEMKRPARGDRTGQRRRGAMFRAA